MRRGRRGPDGARGRCRWGERWEAGSEAAAARRGALRAGRGPGRKDRGDVVVVGWGVLGLPGPASDDRPV